MKFNPFENRLCRDIRNNVGHDFVKSLKTKDHDGFKLKANAYISQYPHRHITDYIRGRLHEFKIIFIQISSFDNNPAAFFNISRMLWNQGLFFEFHEWIEEKWVTAKGDQKRMLQALIMASVAYEQLQYDRISPAKKLAAKALTRIEETRPFIPVGIDTDALIKALRLLSPFPRI